MNAQSTPKNACAELSLLAVLAVLGLALPPHTAQAGNDRIFTDGFEPCCQVGGTVSGLTGGGLVLYLDAGSISETLPVSGNGPYNFTASLAPGTGYGVHINSQPSGQSCTIANASGSMGSTDVDNVDVQCGTAAGLVWDSGVWNTDTWQ